MPAYRVGDRVKVRGFITTENCVRGKSLFKVEETLGFAHGRMAQGLTLVALNAIPATSQFDLRGYTYTPDHRWVEPKDMVISRLKSNAQDTFSIQGDDRLVKIIPTIEHDPRLVDDEQYPFGRGGVHQWKITDPYGIPGTVVAVVTGYPDAIVMPADFKPRYSYT